MGQDIRKMLAGHTPKTPTLEKGHEARFEAKLDEAMTQKNNRPSLFWLKVAAIAIVLVSVAYFGYQQLNRNEIGSEIVTEDTQDVTEDETASQITIGDLSPDLKKVEDFYLNGINVQLATLTVNTENKELIDGYLQRLAELDKEYKALNTELNKVGPTEATITALIDNLKLRLELLFKLKNKLKELKNSENEQVNVI